MTTPEQLEKEAAERRSHPDYGARSVAEPGMRQEAAALDQAIAGWKTQWALAEHWSKAAHRKAEVIAHLHNDVGTLTSDLNRANDRIVELEALMKKPRTT